VTTACPISVRNNSGSRPGNGMSREPDPFDGIKLPVAQVPGVWLNAPLFAMDQNMAEYHVVAATSELPEDGQMHVELNGEEILLCRHQGEFYAVAYYCSHEMYALEGGMLSNGCITCPYHGAEFKLSNGAVKAPPAWEDIRTYAVKVHDGTIAISVGED
jgi:3-phenylpropionate/trans-cinnamate dioxygenase ferredoxin subunit